MVFHEISAECYRWLEKQPNVKEETLTDWLLYQASLKVIEYSIKRLPEMKKLTTVRIGNGGYYQIIAAVCLHIAYWFRQKN